MNKIFVVNKPLFISSNSYLNKIKRKYKVKKAGFSGTLDPFAKGVLIVAFGQYTKLFRYLKKSPKKYIATLWIGASSSSFDIENIYSIKEYPKLSIDDIKKELKNLEGIIKYSPPKFSAKKIKGVRAYKLARDEKEFKLDKITSKVFKTKLLNYSHPFLTFEISVSEGSYIRSIAQILASRLNVKATLSYLYRVSEGEFVYNNEKEIKDIYNFLDLPKNSYFGSKEWLKLGKKLDINYFENKKDGIYIVKFDDFFSIISIKDFKVSYILNNIVLR